MNKLFAATIVLGALAGTAMVASAGCASSQQSDEDVGTALGAAGGGDAGDAGPAPIANGTILITQVYSFGGHSGSKFKYDFVEILNKTTKEIDLEANKVSLQLASSATGPFDTAIPLKGKLGASKYMLIQLGTRNASAPGAAELPAPDQTGDAAVTIGDTGDKAANGRVALANVTDALNCGGTGSNCGTSKVIDLLGFGVASSFEGSATAKPLDATHTLLRAGNDGCTDSGDNSKDFALTEITDTTKPRNSSSDAKDCTPPPKPDASTPKDSGPPPTRVPEPDPGTEPYFDAGYHPEAGPTAQAGGGDDSSCAVGALGLGEGVGSFAPLAGLALAVSLVSRRRRRNA